MKIHRFNDNAALTGVNPKTQRPIDNPASDKVGEEKISKSGYPKGNVSNALISQKGIAAEKDRIELDSNRKAVTKAHDSANTPGNSDSVHIGAVGQNATYSPESISRVSKASGTELRDNKLAEIRARLADGFYNQPEFIERLAEKLIEEFYLIGEGIEDANGG